MCYSKNLNRIPACRAVSFILVRQYQVRVTELGPACKPALCSHGQLLLTLAIAVSLHRPSLDLLRILVEPIMALVELVQGHCSPPGQQRQESIPEKETHLVHLTARLALGACLQASP